MVGIQRHRALGGFAGADPVCWRFNPMVNRITHQVVQRLCQHVENALVEIGVLPVHHQSNFFAA